ncbi:HalOD1 output domain-containing protein [Halorarius litoreus]|uniref:HalOD1 output domain-containing protein n=1 Tax=Halorarius litoreus TaxID=2962676 RepID=UPI0020CD8FA0|nr:HalOD1 output domain-containing protein [Halorarius litoreus]
METDYFASTEPTHRRPFDPAVRNVELSFLEMVADVADCDIDDLPRLWPTLGGLLQHSFATPPADATAVTVEFTYFGYRIRLDSDGEAALVELPADAD